jgi:two-component system CheB/CheR fusion protein
MPSEDTPPVTPPPAPRFPIVGVGSSAGGLEATIALLHELPEDLGAALVVVVHLDPTHPSGLTDILGKATSFPVSTVVDGAVVGPNHVYVIPPNTNLRLVGGALHLEPRSDTPGQNLPIDVFFRSLAEDAQGRAIGVVLSGTGSDGAHGVMAIKAAGGINFAQDGTAKHDGMPRAAVATDCVDFVLEPAEIARELVRLGASPGPGPDAGLDDDEALMARFVVILRAASGVDFTHYKRTSFQRRVQRRMLLNRRGSLREYLELLKAAPSEVDALCEDVLIHVTSFFRDPATFEALGRLVLPRLVQDRPTDAPIRVWVPGCSSGEEAYSIVICLLEVLEAAGVQIPIKMFGTDLSQAAVDQARAGTYLENIAAEVSPARLQRFFVKTETGYRIRKDVRDLCVFARQDVTRDPPFSGMDLISCRNLMIYLDAVLQSRVLPVFHYALKPSGFLVLGASESISTFSGFACLDPKNKIYARTAAPSRLFRDFSDYRGGAEPALPATRPLAAPSHLDIHREADRAVLSAHGPPGVVVTDDLAIIQFRGQTGPFLEPSPGAASLDLLRWTREELRLAVRRTVDEARKTRAVALSEAVRLSRGGVEHAVVIEVIPFVVPSSQQRLLVVLFRELPAPAEAPAASAPPDPAELQREDRLRHELSSTREYLQSVIEQLEAGNEELRAANEEIVSSNEELQSTNEELQTAKEELQATNEELTTVNDEMLQRNAEGTRVNDDVANLLSSVGIPIVILGRDGRVRRFTPAAGKVLSLIATDVGRPFADIKPKLEAPELTEMIADVQANLIRRERTVRDHEGRWHQLSVRPYLTVDNRVDGVTIALLDVDAAKRGEEAFRDMLGAAAEPILIAEAGGRIIFANGAAGRAFGYAKGEEMVGLTIEALVPQRWAAGHAALRQTYMAAPSPRPMAAGTELHARRRDGTEFPVEIGLSPMKGVDGDRVVAFITDISLRREAEAKIRDYQSKLQVVAFETTLAEERERRRIAADLHDRIGQALALAQIKLTALRDTIDGKSRAEMDECVRLVRQTVDDTRTLTFELSPPVLYDLGLMPALAWLADETRKRHGMTVTVEDDDQPKALEDGVAALVFRSVRELLVNVFKHAQVPAAKVALRRKGEWLVLEVSDRGVGFDPASSGEGYGLFGVREQISRLGGTFAVASTPGEGTTITIEVPLRAPAPRGDAG